MRRRFCAMMRNPACSISALIAPVRLRWVASGLMIEKVRSTAIDIVLDWKNLQRGLRAAYSPRSRAAARRRTARAAPAARPRRRRYLIRTAAKFLLNAAVNGTTACESWTLEAGRGMAQNRGALQQPGHRHCGDATQ